MKLNQAGIDLIKHSEGCKLTAYPDPATGGPPWTVGYGHTGPEVKSGLQWTQEQAEQALKHNLAALVAKMTPLIKPVLSDNEFSACVSLTYNIGIGNFSKSTLLKLINLGEIETAAKEFLKWSKADGKVMPGLLLRREAEQRLFLS